MRLGGSGKGSKVRNAVGVCKAVREDGEEVVGGRERVIENRERLEGVGVGWGHGGSIRPEVGNWDLGGSWWGDDKNTS